MTDRPKPPPGFRFDAFADARMGRSLFQMQPEDWLVPEPVGIHPTKTDIGRAVVYRGYAGEVEQGTITSFNDEYVFVRYGLGSTSAATRRDQLEWLT